MVKINVPDMHCEKCVERISNALNEAGLKFDVSLPEKTVTINGCDGCAAKAREALDNLGFTVE